MEDRESGRGRGLERGGGGWEEGGEGGGGFFSHGGGLVQGLLDDCLSGRHDWRMQ